MEVGRCRGRSLFLSGGNSVQALSLQLIAEKLKGEIAGTCVKCPGPNHSEADRSLIVWLSDREPGFTVHSHAGDDPIICKDHVRTALKLEPFKPKRRKTDDEIMNAVAAAAGQQQHIESKPRGTLVATFDYRDANGTLLYQVMKFDHPRKYLQRRPDGNGGWIWKPGDRHILYRLPDLIKFPSGTIFLCEGEKDADRLWSLDLVATTIAGGVWTDECAQSLAGRHVLILEDNDDAGRKRSLEAARQLHGVADTVRIVRLPGLGHKQDVSNWLDQDARRGADELSEVCFDAPIWKPAPEPEPEPEPAPEPEKPEPERPEPPPAKEPSKAIAKFPMLNIDSIIQFSTECEFLIDDLFPRSGLALIWGSPKTGKSFVTMDAFMHVALGREYRGRHVEQGPIIYLGLEGQLGLRKRVLAFIRHHFGDEVPYIPFRLILVPINLVADAKALIEEIKFELGDERPAAVIVDTLARSMPGSEAKDADMAAFIKAADSIYRAFNCLVPIVHHSGWAGDHSRGHSSLPAAVDVEVSIRNNDRGDIIAKIEAAKDGPSGIEIHSFLHPVDTGRFDKNGKPIISMVVLPVEGASIAAKPRKQIKSKSLNLAVKIITDFATEPSQPFSDGPVIQCADTEAVRTEFYRQWVGDQDAKKHAWNRAINTKEVIGQRDGKCWTI